MTAVAVKAPAQVALIDIPEPTSVAGHALLRVRMVGMCGSDLSSFRGANPLVSYPRVLGHEVTATVLEPGSSHIPAGSNVTILPYTNCGRCPSCKRGRPNACEFNQTLGVQRDGAMTELVSVPADKLYPAQLSLKDLALVEQCNAGRFPRSDPHARGWRFSDGRCR